jgi:chromosome segregation ATPase
VGQLRIQQEAVRGELSSANAEVGSLREELQRKHAAVVAAVGETERMARDNVGLLREKQRIDHEQSEMRREFEHIERVHEQATRVRDEATGALSEYEEKLQGQEEERETLEQELRRIDDAMRTKRTEAERHNSSLREAEASSRQRTQGLEHVIEAKQVLWQRAEQERQRLKEASKQSKQLEMAALFQSLHQEEKQAFADLDEEGRRRHGGAQSAGPVEINW